ncbi:M14 family metallopeptidase [Pseudohaliea sp.]|uniref:M14 family metallopeptidase n=1 Tax=Pseudohaliea sp. TaxID=2740289 RepID=UPI0032EC946C
MRADMPQECFLNYEALTEKLKALEASHRDFLRLWSIGRSHEGREIWVLELTNKATGPAADKPALLLDGNIHAVELTASSVAIHHVERMLSTVGTDDHVKRCLDTRAFYVIPRVNPDGAEAALAARPRFLRSGTKPYFHSQGDYPRMLTEDIDGDGRILSMRVKDPNGRWKHHPEDSRVMVPRDPVEEGGDYYRLFAEGSIEGAQPDEIPSVSPREGVDFNRNWPSNWVTEGQQQGAGRYSLSEPETQALARFVSDHPNIFTWVAGHTFSGVFLRPGFAKPDTELPFTDLAHYKAVGERGTQLSGYPAKDAYSGFRINHGESIHGSVEWGYENFGIYTWIVEYWAPHQMAGVEIENFARWFFDHPGEDDLKMVRWGDEVLGSSGFVDWYEFDHPELGPVEIGGWDLIRTLYNPPAHLLDEVIEPFPDWFSWQLLQSPLLHVRDFTSTQLGPEQWKIRAVVENVGYLPTYCSAKSLAVKAVRGVNVSLQIPDGAEFIQGRATQNCGELNGRAFRVSSALLAYLSDQTDDRAVIEWVVNGQEGMELRLEAAHDRAGKASSTITLGAG